MKIVQVNKFYFPEYGTEKYLFGLMDELNRRGHQVIPFAMQHPKNLPSRYERFFVSQVSYQGTLLSWHGLRAFGRMVYSLEARKKFAALLDETQPDLVHVHSIHHQISPSILREATKRGIPVVQTLHDYKLVCPSYLFPLRNGQVCTECRRGNWLHLIKHRAHKNSLLASAAVALESWIHHVSRVYERNVTYFIVPSDDMAQRLIELGVAPQQLRVIPHYLDFERWQASSDLGRGVLFTGRLSPERGLDHVVHVARALPQVPIVIAGDGPERPALEAKIKLQELHNVRVVGRVDGAQLRDLYASTRVQLFPSLTFDTFGLSVLEGMASGKPIVATRQGGVVNLVQDGENGLLYDPQQPDQAVEAIKKLLTDDALARNFGRAARAQAEQFSIDNHYRTLMQAYQDALLISAQAALERQVALIPLTVKS